MQIQVEKISQMIADAGRDQVQSQKLIRFEQDRLTTTLAAVPNVQSEQSVLQTQVKNLNQKVAEVNNVQSQLQRTLRHEQDRRASASIEISKLHSEVQTMQDRAIKAEQNVRSAIAGTDKSVATVMGVLQENSFAHSSLFKVTSIKLDSNLDGFRTNETFLLHEHYKLLNRLIPLLKPLNVNINLIGHTDGRGSYKKVNLLLSYRRALMVSQYITDKFGFPSDRIYVTGRADLKPKVKRFPQSFEMLLKNRRVEIHLEFTGDHSSEKLQ